jgi:hypothetical protein
MLEAVAVGRRIEEWQRLGTGKKGEVAAAAAL